MTNKLRNKEGFGYLDICVGVICFVMLLVIAINLFSFVTLRIELDQIADNLIEAATENGAFDQNYYDMEDAMLEQYYDFDVVREADSYFNSRLGRVQLGNRMYVTVSKQTYIQGLGIFRIPITMTVRKTGLSERYWK